MTESESTLKMPKPESRMIIETTMPAEMRSASKRCRLPDWRCCHEAATCESRSSNSAAISGRAARVGQLHQHEGDEVGLVQDRLGHAQVDEDVLDVEVPDAGLVDHVDAEAAHLVLRAADEDVLARVQVHPLGEAGADASAVGIVAEIVHGTVLHLLAEIGRAQVQVKVDALQRDGLLVERVADEGPALDDGRAGDHLRVGASARR